MMQSQKVATKSLPKNLAVFASLSRAKGIPSEKGLPCRSERTFYLEDIPIGQNHQ